MTVEVLQSENRAVVISPASLDATASILNRIKDKSSPSFQGRAPVSVLDGKCILHHLHLDTKYYTADVQMCLLETAVTFSEIDNQLADSLAENIQALILVFDVLDAGGFEKVKSWEAFVNDYDPPILLCIGYKGDSEAEIPDENKNASSWCFDKGIEYVEITSSDPNGVNEDGEREGVERVVEALENHMWPDLNMKETPSVPAGRDRPGLLERDSMRDFGTFSGADDADAAAGNADTFEPPSVDDVVAAVASDKDAVPGPNGELADGAVDTLAPVADANATEEHQAPEDSNQRTTVPQTVTDVNPFLNAINPADLGISDGDAGEFEGMLEAMRRVRENGQNMSNDSRREAAADLAMKLWSMMGGEEDDEDSD